MGEDGTFPRYFSRQAIDILRKSTTDDDPRPEVFTGT
jgi:hypothetical protein